MADTRKHLSTHYVVRVVVEAVDVTGVIPYNGTMAEATGIDRQVREIGSAVTKDKELGAAIVKAHGHLDLMGA